MASLNPELPPWFIGIVERLLEKDPSRRFNSAKEVSELLEGCLAHLQQPASVPLPAELPVPTARPVSKLRKFFWKGTITMIVTLGSALLGMFLMQSTEPPDIAGRWSGEGWGQVVLAQTAAGEYAGTYSDTVDRGPGKIELRWSRIERRFNGTWSEGEARFGDLSIRLADREIRGALTTDPKSKLNPTTPRLADLTWIKTAKTSDSGTLNAAQRNYRDWTEETFHGLLGSSRWENLTSQEKDAEEEQCLMRLSIDDYMLRVAAINTLAALKSKKAVSGLLKIAAERTEKDNRDRWMAIRALGIIGDPKVVPELVQLTYHYNQNTRFWAQISLVRLTGENFGRDVAAWREWWSKQGGKPPIAEQKVVWATSPEAIQWSSPEKIDEMDRQWASGKAEAEKSAAGGPPQIVSVSPVNGVKDVDPAMKEVTVTFDRDMSPSFTWNGKGADFPFVPDSNAFWRDNRTCVLPVKLEPGRSYRIGLNTFSPNHQSFCSAQGVRVLPTTICFSTRGTRCPDEGSGASKSQVEPPKVEPNSQTVVEGVGWESFRVGAHRDELIKTYGNPEPSPGTQWTGWIPRHHIDCWFDPAGRVTSVQFHEGFKLPLTSGVKIGSSENQVLSAYGVPEELLQQPQWREFVYYKRGLILWLMDSNVVLFNVMQQRNASSGPLLGIGVALGREDDHVVVRKVFPKSPAESAGMESGDLLLEIDGHPLKGSTEEAVKSIRGEAGTVVKIKVRKKDGTAVEIAITREPLSFP